MAKRRQYTVDIVREEDGDGYFAVVTALPG